MKMKTTINDGDYSRIYNNSPNDEDDQGYQDGGIYFQIQTMKSVTKMSISRSWLFCPSKFACKPRKLVRVTWDCDVTRDSLILFYF
jgi:hypothetical protein